jgi:hypothetical protein
MDLFPSLGPAMNERAGTSEVMRQVIDRRAGKPIQAPMSEASI